MRSRPFILRCAAFLLILVLSQKAGAGLFVHNFLHNTAANNNTTGQENENGKDFSYACSCIDDFLMPFAETEGVAYPQPVSDFTNLVSIFKEHISFHTPVFSFLRGPPTDLL
jgi:hypothetical protein